MPIPFLHRLPGRRPRQLAASLPRGARTLLCLAGLHAAAGHALELNTANQAELEQVKGVGPQLSGRLLEERDKGPFKDWADLIRRMKGVGPASAARLSGGGLTVAGQVYPTAQAASAPASSAAEAPAPSAVRR